MPATSCRYARGSCALEESGEGAAAAEAHFRRALELNPSYGLAAVQLAKIMHAQGRFGEEEALLRAILSGGGGEADEEEEEEEGGGGRGGGGAGSPLVVAPQGVLYVQQGREWRELMLR
jgi:hypothetical protein